MSRRQKITLAASLAVVALLALGTYVPLRSHRRTHTKEGIQAVLEERNLWGTQLRRAVWYDDGHSESGPVDDRGRRHGRWTVERTRGEIGFEDQYYFHGEPCTPAAFHERAQ